MDSILKASGWALNNARPWPPSKPALIAFFSPFSSGLAVSEFTEKHRLPKSFWNDWGVKINRPPPTGGVCTHVFVPIMCLCVFMCVSIPAGKCEPVCYYCMYIGPTLANVPQIKAPYLLSVTSSKEQEADSWQDAPPFFINITCTATEQSLGSLSADWLLLWAVVDRKREGKKEKSVLWEVFVVLLL